MLDRIKELLRKNPFTPFRLILTSGHTYEVTSPWMIAFGKTGLAYFFAKSDRLAELRLNQLAAIETLEVQDV
jgi:hypothetical protein